MKAKCLYPVNLLLFLLLPFFVPAKTANGKSVSDGAINKPIEKPAELYFMQNSGQLIDQYGKRRADIDFALNSNVNVFIGTGHLHYQWNKIKAADLQTDSDQPSQIEAYRLDVTLSGANPNAEFIAEQKQEYYENYYMRQCPNGARAYSYKKITYKNIYPEIDWVLTISSDGLKYDFIVRPGGKVSDIKLRYEGATSLKLKNGALTATTPFGSITEHAPYSYALLNGEKTEIASSFVLNEHELSFNVAPHNGTLVLDPGVNWGTYYGGTADDRGYTVATDTSGNAYIGGYTTTNSASVFASSGAHQTSYKGNADAFVAKFNRSCGRVWSTFYGDTAKDYFFSSTIDKAGYLYFAGITSSPDSTVMTTAGVHQRKYGGGITDALLVKFDSNGVRQSATYYGGPGRDDDGASEYQVWVTRDSFNNIYLCGNTFSTNGIATAGSHQPAISNNTGTYKDGYLAKFNSSGTRLWGTYYGDSLSDENMVKIVIDINNDVYVAGNTNTLSDPLNKIATSGSHQSSPGGLKDAFLVKFNPSGARQWGTFYGGSIDDSPQGLVADLYGYIYMSGSTTSSNNISTSGSFQPNPAGVADVFLTKFNAAGTRQWGTFYGGSQPDQCGDMAIDDFGNICFTGWSFSSSGITTPDAYQTTLLGTLDAFMAIFTVEGFRYWASYYGGNGFDNGYGLKYSKTGDLFLSGTTLSSNSIAQPTGIPHQSTFGGTNDAFLVRFGADTSTFFVPPFPATNFCGGDSVYIPYGVTNPFRSGNVFSVQLSNASGSFASPTVIGSRTATGAGLIGCRIPPATPTGSGYRLRLVSSLPSSTSLDNQLNISIITAPATPVGTHNGPLCTGQTLQLSSTTISGVSYSWTGPNSFIAFSQNPTRANITLSDTGYYIVSVTANGCTAKDTTPILTIKNGPDSAWASSNGSICEGDTIKLFSGSKSAGATYSWTGPGSFTSITKDTVRASALAAWSGTYTVTITFNGCAIPLPVSMSVAPAPQNHSASSNGPVCTVDTIKLFANTTTTPVTYAWTGPNSFTSTVQNPTILNPTSAKQGYYKVKISSNNNCFTLDSTMVYVNQTPSTPVASSNSPLCSGDTLRLNSSSTPGCVYSWQGPPIYGGVSKQNDTVPNVTTAYTGNYTTTAKLYGAVTGECTSKTTIAVVVNLTPVQPTAGSNSPVCERDTIMLTASTSTPGVLYNWTGPNSFSSTQQNPNIYNAVFANAGTYTVKAISGSCSSSRTTIVSIKPTPVTPTVGPNVPLCSGSTLFLTATTSTSGVTWKWTGPGSWGPVFLQNTSRTNTQASWSGNYTVTADLNGCPADTTFNVLIKQSPDLTSSSNSPVCIGDNIIFSASSLTSGVTYAWSGPGGFNPTIPNPVITNSNLGHTGDYYISVTAPNNCVTIDTLNVQVKNPPPIPSVSGITPVCSGDTIRLNAFSTSGASYTWVGPGGFSSTQQNPKIGDVIPTQTGYYKAQAIIGSCISGADSVFILVNPTPDPHIAGTDAICDGDTIKLNVTDSVTGASYSWIGAAGFTSTNKDITIANSGLSRTGNYVVTATALGCIGKDTFYVLVKPVPAKPDVSSNSPVCDWSELKLSTPGTTGYTYSWNGPNGFSSILQNPSRGVRMGDSGVYTLRVNLNGCYAENSTTVKMKPLPPAPDAISNSPLYVGDVLKLNVTNQLAGGTYLWLGPRGFLPAGMNQVINPVAPADSGKYIVMVTFDGCTSSDTVDVTIKRKSQNFFIIVYPNPNDGNFKIKGYFDVDQGITFEVLDMLGQRIFRDGVVTKNQEIDHDVHLPYLSDGMYILRVDMDLGLREIKFVVKH
jgi:hypothetical protein